MLAACAALLAACGTPVGFDAGPDLDAGLDARDVATRFEAGPDVPLPGRVCRTNADCDDRIDCTDDLCGSDNRCVSLPNSTRCDDGVFCNGPERCDLRRGCTRGEPVNCNDDYVCTADRCVEATRTCDHRPLDRDGDGDPDDHCQARACGDAGVPEPDAGVMTACWRGRDCDDANPRVSSLSPEICGDMIDNNCNGAVDDREPGGCRRAPHDDCANPLDVSAGGFFTLDLAAARTDHPIRCVGGLAHDVVLRFRLTEARDVDIEGTSRTSVVGLALQTACGSAMPADEVECDGGFPARIRRHSLPAGEYFLIVGTSGTAPVDLSVRFSPATPPPTNDTCAGAIAIPPEGGTYNGDLAGIADDVSTRCGGIAGDVVYTFTLTDARDVSLQLAGGRLDYLHLTLARSCARMPDVLRCDSGSTVQFTAHQLPAGTYYVFVESFEPVSYVLQATFLPPTPPARGDTCADPIPLAVGAPVRVAGGALENDYRLSCYATGRDAVLRFVLTERRDVLVNVQGTSAGDYFAVAIQNECGTASPVERTCVTGSPARAFGIGLDPGTYYVVVKPTRATDFDVRLETFMPLAVTDISGNDTCGTGAGGPHAIPPGRGYYRSNTMPLRNDYTSPCAGATPGKDAVHSITLAARSRVTLVAEASFFHVAWITRNDRCPGTAPTVAGQTCTLGTRTTLDLVLEPGTYYYFVDGLAAGYEGAYGLLVHVAPP